jgi:hypothetical protein
MLRSIMQTEEIVALLIAERDRLSSAIEALRGGIKRRVRLAGARRKGAAASESVVATSAAKPKRRVSTASRKAMADAARKRWAAIRSGKAKSPFAKTK